MELINYIRRVAVLVVRLRSSVALILGALEQINFGIAALGKNLLEYYVIWPLRST